MLQAFLDEGALVRNGTVKVTQTLTQVRLPPTVQGILAARIDRQPPAHKHLLQTLAVIGREARLGLINQLIPMDERQLQQMLAELQTSEFIYARAMPSDAEYVFKHALTQEVAYNSMLIERRKVVHERAGQVLESMFSDQLEDHLNELARHYSNSANFSKGVDYLERAGQQALQRCAPTDATSYLASAIDLLNRLPEDGERSQRELRLRMTIGSSFILLKGWAAIEVEQAFTRALEICQHAGNPPELFLVLYGLWSNYHVRGVYRAAREKAHELLNLAHISAEHTQLILAHYAMGETSLHTGDLKLARGHLEIMLSLYDEPRDRPLAFRTGVDMKSAILSYTGWNLWLLGYPDKALAASIEAGAFVGVSLTSIVLLPRSSFSRSSGSTAARYVNFKRRPNG